MPSVPFTPALQPAFQAFKRLTTIPKKEAKLTVGLDIGSASVKVLALGPRKGLGARPVLGQHAVPLPSGQTPDASGAIKTALAALPIPVRSVNVAVSGPWVIMRIVELPTMKPAEMKQALPFEAQRYLPFNLQEVVIDGVMLGPADAHKMWVLIVACKKELIERRLDAIKRAGLEAALIDVDALAVANAFLAGRNGAASVEGTRALINVGAQLTSLVIFHRDIPYLVRDIPWGAEKLTRGMAEQLGTDAAAVAQRVSQSPPAPDTLTAMKAATEALVSELQLSFDYFENRFGQPPAEMLVSGGLAQAAGFCEALKGHIAQPVSAWTPRKDLPGHFVVAYGLALRSE